MTDPDVYRRLDALDLWRDDMASVEIGPVDYGSAFPAGWPQNVPFYRTDLARLYYYNGSLWVPLTGQIGARAYNSANISVNNTTNTLLTFNSELYDTDGFHSTSSLTGRLTIPSGLGGHYLISAQARFQDNSTGFRQFQVQVNATTVIVNVCIPAVTGNETEAEAVTVYDLNDGDYLEMYAFQNSGGALNVLSSSAWSPHFMLARL